MKKITITIQNNTILFKYRTNKPIEVNLLNTNVISNNELVFSDQYLIENTRIVSLFLNDLIIEKNITDVVISNNVLAELVLDLLKTVQEIESVTTKYKQETSNIKKQVINQDKKNTKEKELKRNYNNIK